MDLITLLSDLFGFYITSCITSSSWTEEKWSFSLCLECFNSFGLVWYFSFLLKIFFAFLPVGLYHIIFLLIFFTVHGIVHLFEIFFYLCLAIGSCRFMSNLNVYTCVIVVYLADGRLGIEVRDKQRNLKLLFTKKKLEESHKRESCSVKRCLKEA